MCPWGMGHRRERKGYRGCNGRGVLTAPCPSAQFSSVTQSCPTPATPWTVAHQAPLTHGILQARMLEWVSVSSSRGSSAPRDGPGVSCISHHGTWVLYLCEGCRVLNPFFFFFTFWPCHTACGILVPQPRVEPRPPSVKVQSLNLWTTREAPPLGNFSDWFPLPSPAVFCAATLVSPQAVEEGGTCLFPCIESS